jgi:hydrogenase maturation factor
MGGGVWRIKQLHRNAVFDVQNVDQKFDVQNVDQKFGGKYLAVAAMHNGFHIVDADKAEIVASYTDEHKSLAYGIDIRDECCPFPENESLPKHSDQLWLASCSFYDHTLKLWNVHF